MNGKMKKFDVITYHQELSAVEIGEIYKKRWAIELFFKWLKQNLKIRKFLGLSENAVRLQIWIALITYLLCRHPYLEKISDEPNTNEKTYNSIRFLTTKKQFKIKHT